MKVWVAEHLDMACEENVLLGVFSTEAKAIKALSKHGFPTKPYQINIDEEYPEE